MSAIRSRLPDRELADVTPSLIRRVLMITLAHVQVGRRLRRGSRKRRAKPRLIHRGRAHALACAYTVVTVALLIVWMTRNRMNVCCTITVAGEVPTDG